MAAPNRDSTFDEIDRLLNDTQFCEQIQALFANTGETRTIDGNEKTDLRNLFDLLVNASQGSSVPTTLHSLNTASLEVNSFLLPEI